MDKRYQVFVSSTYADLQQERQKVLQALMEMDCIPAGMELFPAADDEQWQFIKRIIDDCDYYILIIGGRYGSISAQGISYTEMEFDYAIKRGLKVLAFVHASPDEIAVGKSDIEPALRVKLAAFRAKVTGDRMVKFWSNASELPGLVALSLQKTIKVYPAVGWMRADGAKNPELLADLNILRKENDALKKRLMQVEGAQPDLGAPLAGLDEYFALRVRWKVSDGSFRGANLNLTWGQIFGALAPELRSAPSDFNAKVALEDILRPKLNGAVGGHSVILEGEDFRTIQIQLAALGFITATYSSADSRLIWKLTALGERMMMRLRTVKSANPKND
jgi:hypothetical protein